jgi:hypothetical protein
MLGRSGQRPMSAIRRVRKKFTIYAPFSNRLSIRVIALCRTGLISSEKVPVLKGMNSIRQVSIWLFQDCSPIPSSKQNAVGSTNETDRDV